MIFLWYRCIDLTINNFFLCPYSPGLHELHPTGRLHLSSTLQYLSFPPSFSMTFFVAVLLRLRCQPLFYARRYLETSLTSSTENWSELSWWWLNLLGKPSLRKPGKQKCFRPKARAEFVPQHFSVSRAAELRNICDRDKVSTTMFPSLARYLITRKIP